jgi:hypothetical protein
MFHVSSLLLPTLRLGTMINDFSVEEVIDLPTPHLSPQNFSNHSPVLDQADVFVQCSMAQPAVPHLVSPARRFPN